MAKGSHEFTVPIEPYAAFNTLGAAMVHCGVKPFRQEGWTLSGQESLSLFKMGYPVTVVASVGDDGRGGSRIMLQGSNFGWGFNSIYVRKLLRRLDEAVTHAATQIARTPGMPTAGVPNAGGPGVAPYPRDDNANLPPRIF